MPNSSTPENEPNIHTRPQTDEILEYVLSHKDGLRKEAEKRFNYVGENYVHFLDHINAQCTALACQQIAEGLGITYEDVASVLDYETLKNLVGEQWFKF